MRSVTQQRDSIPPIRQRTDSQSVQTARQSAADSLVHRLAQILQILHRIDSPIRNPLRQLAMR
jgi:hypothetical protein